MRCCKDHKATSQALFYLVSVGVTLVRGARQLHRTRRVRHVENGQTVLIIAKADVLSGIPTCKTEYRYRGLARYTLHVTVRCSSKGIGTSVVGSLPGVRTVIDDALSVVHVAVLASTAHSHGVKRVRHVNHMPACRTILPQTIWLYVTSCNTGHKSYLPRNETDLLHRHLDLDLELTR